MKDHEYEVVLNYVKKSIVALAVVVDELQEFGDEMDERFVAEAKDLMNKVNKLHNKLTLHQRVKYLLAREEALRAP